MARKSFEQLESWKKARRLTSNVYRITQSGRFARDYGLSDQLRRASVSIMSNIAEGLERGGNKELIYFLFVAKGSASEVSSQLYVALDQSYIDEAEHRSLQSECHDIRRLLGGFIRYLKRSDLERNKLNRGR